MSNADYIRTLRPLLPAKAFCPNPRAFIPIGFHLTIVVAGWIATLHTHVYWWPLISIGIAISMSALAFLGHDLSHRSITTNRYLLYPTELLVFSLLYLPPTLWRKIHGSHHAHTNADGDPDRRFLTSELNGRSTVAAALLFPNKAARFFPFFILYWAVFPIRHGITAFYRRQSLPPFATARPSYSIADKLWIVFEFVAIVALQSAIWKLVGGRHGFIAVSLMPVIVASAIVSWYVFTNHGLMPIVRASGDSLATTMTVTVPELFNKLHSNFSYHAEHHLFPTMNSKYYPMVSELFRRRFPDRYHYIPMSKAWSLLMRNSIGYADHAAPAIPETHQSAAVPAAGVNQVLADAT